MVSVAAESEQHKKFFFVPWTLCWELRTCKKPPNKSLVYAFLQFTGHLVPIQETNKKGLCLLV
jgi:hypothetical protein